MPRAEAEHRTDPERRAQAEHGKRLDEAKLRRYARAVFTSTDVYIAPLPDEALSPTRGDMLVRLLSGLLLSLSMRRGEITCLLALSCGGR